MKPLFRFPILLIFFLIFNIFSVSAKSKAPKWGKVSKEEKALKEVPYDKEAHAVVIAETGLLTYNGAGFSIKRHTRIKILDKEGIEEATLAIPYYSKGRFQHMSGVKGQTLEILENGKVIKHKLHKKEVYNVAIDEEWSEIRFALPAARVGCIIEFSYSFHTSNYTFLEGWVFQNSIPTLYSSFKVEIPTFLSYTTLMQGNKIYEKYATQTGTNEWSLQNLTALKEEPYTYNLLDYAEKIQFQLQSYKTTAGLYAQPAEKAVLSDWQAIADRVLSSAKSSQFLRPNRLPEELTLKTPSSPAGSLQQAKQCYTFVQQQFNWSNVHGILPDKNLKDLLQEKKGNGAALNLLLCSMLQKAGYKAQPALISTKMHGRVSPKYAMLSQFNHLVCALNLEGKQYLLDAAGNKLSFGILPVKDLNEHALVLSDEFSWQKISDQAKSSTIMLCTADLNTGLYKFDCQWKGYDALELPEELDAGKLHQLLNTRGVAIPDSTLINKKLAAESKVDASFRFIDQESFDAERIYYQLAVPGSFQKNPFKTETRHFPVDFGHRFSRQLVYNIKLPDGYTIEDSPESVLLRTPDGQAVFTFQAGLAGNNLNIQISLAIKNNLILVDQYPHLRELYNKMILHCEQPLVLLRFADAK